MENVWDIFATLSATRMIGMTPSPITVSDVKAYLDLQGYDDPVYRQEVFLLVRAMDSFWLQWHAERAEHKVKK